MPLPRPAGARARHLYIAAVIVLLSGWLAAAFLYLGSRGEVVAPVSAAGAGARAYGVEPRDSKQYMSDVENVGGQAALLTDEAHTWLAGFFRPRGRAILLAAVTAAAASGIVFAAWRASRPLR